MNKQNSSLTEKTQDAPDTRTLQREIDKYRRTFQHGTQFSSTTELRKKRTHPMFPAGSPTRKE